MSMANKPLYYQIYVAAKHKELKDLYSLSLKPELNGIQADHELQDFFEWILEVIGTDEEELEEAYDEYRKEQGGGTVAEIFGGNPELYEHWDDEFYQGKDGFTHV